MISFDKNITISLKDAIVTIIWLISFGIAIGKLVSIFDQMEKLDESVQKMTDEVSKLKTQNASVEAKLQIVIDKCIR